MHRGTPRPKLTATAFYANYKDTCYLISNWHVFAARNPETNAFVEADGFEPDSVRAHVHTMPTYKLKNDAGDPLWPEHPRGQSYDIAALEVPKPEARVPGRFAISLDIFTETDSAIPLVMGMSLFVLGYPLEEDVSGSLPIWKQATLASEPTAAIAGKPCFLVDTASRPGMSGAPVLIRDINIIKLANGQFQAAGPTRFVGVYSERYVRDDVHLGRVWPETLVHEMLEAQIPARR